MGAERQGGVKIKNLSITSSSIENVLNLGLDLGPILGLDLGLFLDNSLSQRFFHWIKVFSADFEIQDCK